MGEWGVPLPPVRFPLRDALLSLADPGGYETSAAGPETKPPLKAKANEKYRALRRIGLQRRHGTSCHLDILPGELFQPTPLPPVGVDARKPGPKTMTSRVSAERRGRCQEAEDAGLQWPLFRESRSAPVLGEASASSPPRRQPSVAAGGAAMSRETWTSATRAVVARSRRHATDGARGGCTAPDWVNTALRCSQGQAPTAAKDWARRGFEFMDRGFGIGVRPLDVEAEAVGRRAPGHVYNSQAFGDVASWKLDVVSKPSRQASAKHVSAEVHRFGARWRDPPQQDDEQPCPGSYDVPGFVEEAQRKLARARAVASL